MNEQLKELYYKAHDTSDVEGSFPQYFSATKFAELIVRKCADICHERKLTPSTFTGEELLEYFDIKEK